MFHYTYSSVFSAFVGVAVMLACLPLPGWVAKLIQSIQETAMKKTDARVQTVTESMLSLFMSTIISADTAAL